MAGVEMAEKQHVGVGEIARILREEQGGILIVSHQRPDGDCLGSTMGLLLGLRKLGKKVAAYNASPLGAKWEFVAGIAAVQNKLPDWTPSLTVFVDCGGVKRVADDFAPAGMTVNIDHHLTNERFGDVNYIDIDACAVGEQIFLLLDQLGVAVDRDIASALFLSILTDTGSFRYSNTSARAFHLAGDLVAAGAEPGAISMAVYESRTKGEYALTARVYGNLRYEMDDKLVWSELRLADYEAAGGPESEPEGLVTDIRGVVGVEVSCLIHEVAGGGVRAGFRGKGSVDCSAIAQACGGGGHFNASGAFIKDVPYEVGKARVLAELRRGVAEWLKSR